MHTITSICSVMVVILTLPTDLLSQEVLPKQDNVKVSDGVGNTGVLKGFAIYTVVKREDSRIFVKRDGQEGWVEQSEMVLLTTAVSYYDELIRKDSKSDWAYARRGYATAKGGGSLPAALSDLTEAITLNPKAAQWWAIRAFVQWRAGNIALAISDVDESIRLTSNDADAFNMRGAIYLLEKRDPGKAEPDFAAAIKLNPKHKLARTNRASALGMLSRHNEALQEFEKAIELAPTDSMAFANRGSLWIEMRKDDKALADFEKAITLDNKNAVAFGSRGSLWFARREYKKALEDLNEACRLDPSSILLNNRGMTFLRLNDFEKAAFDFSYVLALDRDNLAARHRRGLVHLQKNELDEALRHFEAVLQKDNPKNAALIGRAHVWAKKKEYEKAHRDFFDALAEPALDYALRDCARFLSVCPEARFRDGKRAVELARKACELSHDGDRDACYLGTVAAAYAEAGEFAEAVRWQRRALEDSLLSKESRQKEMRALEGYEKHQPLREASSYID
jgi:tetratricopeptide (TPR) repeat protein